MPENRHSGRIPLAEVGGQAVQEEIGRARRVRRPGRRTRRRCHLLRCSTRTCQAPCEQRGIQRVQVGGTGKVDVDPLEPPRGLEQQRRSVATPVRDECELGEQQVDASAPELIERSRLRPCQQRQRRVERSRLDLRLSGGQRPFRPPGRVRRQHRGPLEERTRGGQPTTRSRPPGRALQLASHRLVRLHCRLGAMPGPPVGIDPRIEGLGQRPVRRPPILRGGRPIDGGAGQRMAEPHVGAEFEPVPRPRLGAAASTGMPCRRAARHSKAASPDRSAAAVSSSRRLSRGSDRNRWEKLCSMRLATGRGSGARNRRPDRPGRDRGATEQGERVATGLGRDPVRTCGSSGPWTAEASNARASRSPSPRTVSWGRPASSCSSPTPARRTARRPARPAAAGLRTPRLAGKSDQAHAHRRPGRQAAGPPAPWASRLSTARPTSRRSGAVPSCSPKRDPQRVTLRPRQLFQLPEHRPAQLVADRRTGAPSPTRSRGSQNPEARRPARRVPQQTPSCRSRARRTEPAPRCCLPARCPAPDPAPRARCAGPATGSRDHRWTSSWWISRSRSIGSGTTAPSACCRSPSVKEAPDIE